MLFMTRAAIAWGLTDTSDAKVIHNRRLPGSDSCTGASGEHTASAASAVPADSRKTSCLRAFQSQGWQLRRSLPTSKVGDALGQS